MRIEHIQQLLKDGKYYTGEVDGDVGPLTREAVRKITERNVDKLANRGSGWNENRKMIAAAQLVLGAQGYYRSTIDGLIGPMTRTAVTTWEKARKPPAPTPVAPHVPVPDDGVADYSKFDSASAKRLKGAHPLLQRLLIAARAQIPFTVMDSQRGRVAQETAFRKGHSKAKFGQSAHNWDPAVAVDLAPTPLDWNNKNSFIALWKVIGYYDPKSGKGAGLALQMKIPLRWGGDWNMNGLWTDDGWDFPHFELYPWRDFAANSKLFEG